MDYIATDKFKMFDFKRAEEGLTFSDSDIFLHAKSYMDHNIYFV